MPVCWHSRGKRTQPKKTNNMILETVKTSPSPAVAQPPLVRGGMLTILRVYNNGDRLKQTLPHDQAMAEIEYSKKMRPGCALFVGADCVQSGYLSMDRLVAIGHELSSANDKAMARGASDPPLK